MDTSHGGSTVEERAKLTENDQNTRLFDSRKSNEGDGLKKLFMFSMLVSILLIFSYRVTNGPPAGEGGGGGGTMCLWVAMFVAEVLFGIYWVVTQPVRLNVVQQHPFKDKLLQRYRDAIPSVDIFVCTADPKLEPPVLVVNTVLSAMSYNYPPEKLSVYLSDDGGSEFTFYALIEAAKFSKQWIPFCRKFSVEPRSPEAFFAANSGFGDDEYAQKLMYIKELFNGMKKRIEEVIESGRVPDEVRVKHKGFLEWDSEFTKQNHKSVVQILIDGRGTSDVDSDGCTLPKLVYMAREKRPEWPHNFKAGAVNALIRVSSEISNGPLILNLDCDMYPNNPDTIQEILCFFMDETKGHEIAYVQFPQHFSNITKNDHYGNAYGVTSEIELAGLGGYGAALYCGTGCFHRRESLCGWKFSNDNRNRPQLWTTSKTGDKSVNEMEKTAKVLADCFYEKNTSWGREAGLVYGCPVEDIVTGLTIQCRGWKSVYYNPKKKAFLGVAPTTLNHMLIQHRRWSQGMFQIFCSRYCPFIYGHGKIKLGAQMGYCIFLLWPLCALATFIYVVVPSVCLLTGISVFPQVSSLWFLPFAYVFLATFAYSLVEAMHCGYTLQRWWNFQRMWLIRMTTSYLYAFIDVVMKQLGLSDTPFVLTSKTVDSNAMTKYEEEVIDFGHSTFTSIIFSLALLNLVALITGAIRILTSVGSDSSMKFSAQMILCSLQVTLNLPVYITIYHRR